MQTSAAGHEPDHRVDYGADRHAARQVVPEVVDLRLVAAVARLGSVGAAARELRVAQPSASQRLARLERALGVRLFTRDTRGTRTTPAGDEMVRQAQHLLDHLDRVHEAVRGSVDDHTLHVGCFDSIATALLPTLDDLVGHVEQRVDHGDRLVEWVGGGTMDAAFVAIAGQLELPSGVRVHPVGTDSLCVYVPDGAAEPRTGRAPLRDLVVPFTTYDLGSVELRDRLVALGARPRRGATTEVVVAMARRHRAPAVLPRSALSRSLGPGDRVLEAPFTSRLRLSMVTGPHPDPRLVDTLPRVRDELSLQA